MTAEMVIENLKDAGCNKSTIEKFMVCAGNNRKEKQLEILETQRADLLKRIHKDEKRISCLDYLVYQISRDNSSFCGAGGLRLTRHSNKA